MSDRGAVAALSIALLVVAAVLAGPAYAQDVPPLEGRVNDYADIIPPSDESRIESQLRALEDETGAQVVVLTVPSLEGGSIEDFSIRVVDDWALGREEYDDGVLVLVARDDREMRIEVGYGLEGAIPDMSAGRIINEQMAPRFREGDFSGGIESAVTSLGGLIRGEELPPPAGPEVDFDPGSILSVLLMVLLFAAWSLPRVIAWILYAAGAPIIIAGGWYISGPAAGIGLGALWLIGFPLLRLAGRAGVFRGGGGRWMGGSGWSSGGSAGSFGGFSGGGGGFGGGGASGRW